MIRGLYIEFGFITALLLCVLIVVSFIFWMAGIAGLLANPDRKKGADLATLLLCIFVPPYPIIWLIGDMVREYVTLRKHSAQNMRVE